MLADEALAQRRSALRALLAKPLLTAEADAEELVLVRRHLSELRDWLGRETGWRLHADSETARLFKTATGPDPTRPARGRAKEPFGRRRYVLLCLALATLERTDAQTTLGQLAEEILNAATEPELVAAGMEFTLEHRTERADLVAVVRALLDWGVLGRVAGDEETYLSASGDVLYDVHRPVLAAFPTGSRGPSTITSCGFEERIAALTEEQIPDTDDLRNQALRRRLTRRLLDDPVVYYDQLDDDERDYLVSQRHAITRRIETATGLLPEIRAEGIAMVDPDDDLTDIKMPEQHTDGHVTLLVAEHLAARDETVRDGATMDELHTFIRRAAAEHTSFWRKGVTEPGAERELLATALAKLSALCLVDVDGERVRALPAIGRYAIDEPTVRDSRKARP